MASLSLTDRIPLVGSFSPAASLCDGQPPVAPAAEPADGSAAASPDAPATDRGPKRKAEEAAADDDAIGDKGPDAGDDDGDGCAKPRAKRARGRNPRQTRTRQYVKSVCLIDGVRRHVVVSCMRKPSGGFKCTFRSEKHRVAATGGAKAHRANAKGGQLLERRYDSFSIVGASDDPFPSHDEVFRNFAARGIDVAHHVRAAPTGLADAPSPAGPTAPAAAPAGP
jgi:hypothetical protein